MKVYEKSSTNIITLIINSYYLLWYFNQSFYICFHTFCKKYFLVIFNHSAFKYNLERNEKKTKRSDNERDKLVFEELFVEKLFVCLFFFLFFSFYFFSKEIFDVRFSEEKLISSI